MYLTVDLKRNKVPTCTGFLFLLRRYTNDTMLDHYMAHETFRVAPTSTRTTKELFLSNFVLGL
jgi:hypothetical protein